MFKNLISKLKEPTIPDPAPHDPNIIYRINGLETQLKEKDFRNDVDAAEIAMLKSENARLKEERLILRSALGELGAENKYLKLELQKIKEVTNETKKTT